MRDCPSRFARQRSSPGPGAALVSTSCAAALRPILWIERSVGPYIQSRPKEAHFVRAFDRRYHFNLLALERSDQENQNVNKMSLLKGI